MNKSLIKANHNTIVWNKRHDEKVLSYPAKIVSMNYSNIQQALEKKCN